MAPMSQADFWPPAGKPEVTLRATWLAEQLMHAGWDELSGAHKHYLLDVMLGPAWQRSLEAWLVQTHVWKLAS